MSILNNFTTRKVPVAAVQPTKKPKLDFLPFPIKNTGRLHSADPTEMLNLDLIDKGARETRSSVMRPSADYALARIRKIKMVATRTTPCISVADAPSASPWQYSMRGRDTDTKRRTMFNT